MRRCTEKLRSHRRCDGGFRRRIMYFATVACKTEIPSFINFP
jgi:hypothetical protein